MTVYFLIPLPKIPYIHRIYMVLANPTDIASGLLHGELGTDHATNVQQTHKAHQCLIALGK